VVAHVEIDRVDRLGAKRERLRSNFSKPAGAAGGEQEPCAPGCKGARSGRAHVRVLTPGGDLAASGHVALDETFAIYDRIVTEPAHQRRGLGRAVMHTLQALARTHGRHVGALVATDQGRRLYESLGWRLHAPWATAVIPGPDAAP